MMRRFGALITALVVVAFVASCTGADDERPPATTATSTQPTAVERFVVSDDAVWRGDTAGLPDIMTAGWLSGRSVGGRLLLEQANTTTAVVDPATGKPDWYADPALAGGKPSNVRISNSTGRAPLTTVGGAQAMVVNYNTGDTSSVAAVRVRDASPLWKVPAPGTAFDVVAADDRTVLLTVGARQDRPVTRALGAANGSTRWDAKGVWGQAVTEGRVLGAVSSQPPELAAADSTVVGLDGATGKQVWSLSDRYGRSEVGFVTGSVALLYVRAEPRHDDVVLVDTATGAEIERLGSDFGGKNSCADDGSRLIACTLDTDDGSRLVTFDVEKRAKHVSTGEVEDALVTDVWRDTVFVEGIETRGDTWAVDREGRAISKDLPGDLIGISDDYAVFSADGDRVVAVHSR